MAFKQALANAIDSAVKFTDKNAPAILSGLALAGLVTTVVLTIHATKEATLDIIEDEDLPIDEDGNVPKKEIVKKVWKRYVPVVGSVLITGFCIIRSEQINSTRNAALVAACEVSDTLLRTYKQEVIEQIGKTKEKKIQAGADKKMIEKNPPSEELVKEVCDIRLSDMLFYDQHAGYFASNPDKIKTAAHKANDYMHKDRVSVADFIWDCGCKKITDDCYDYYFDDNESGEICVEDLVTYNEEELYGRTFVVGTLHYNAVDRRRYMF